MTVPWWLDADVLLVSGTSASAVTRPPSRLFAGGPLLLPFVTGPSGERRNLARLTQPVTHAGDKTLRKADAQNSARAIRPEQYIYQQYDKWHHGCVFSSSSGVRSRLVPSLHHSPASPTLPYLFYFSNLSMFWSSILFLLGGGLRIDISTHSKFFLSKKIFITLRNKKNWIKQKQSPSCGVGTSTLVAAASDDELNNNKTKRWQEMWMRFLCVRTSGTKHSLCLQPTG